MDSKPASAKANQKKLRRQNYPTGECGIESARHLDHMPNEILELILSYALSGSQLEVVNTFNRLKNVSRRWRILIRRLTYQLPSVHIGVEFKNGNFNMIDIVKKFGTFSGLAIALKETIGKRWKSATIELELAEYSWFCVKNIYWK